MMDALDVALKLACDANKCYGVVTLDVKNAFNSTGNGK